MVEPPGPIPNPEVKRYCADGSGAIGPVRVSRCQFFMPPVELTLNRRLFLCRVLMGLAKPRADKAAVIE